MQDNEPSGDRESDIKRAVSLIERHFSVVILIAEGDGSEAIIAQGASPQECAGFALQAANLFLESEKGNTIVDNYKVTRGKNVSDLLPGCDDDRLSN